MTEWFSVANTNERNGRWVAGSMRSTTRMWLYALSVSYTNGVGAFTDCVQKNAMTTELTIFALKLPPNNEVSTRHKLRAYSNWVLPNNGISQKPARNVPTMLPSVEMA